MKPASPPVSRALVLICEKCGKKISGDGHDNVARQMQQSLKSTIADAGQKGVVRAVVTTCLNVCPKDAVAVAFVPSHGSSAEYFTVEAPSLRAAEAELLARALSYSPAPAKI